MKDHSKFENYLKKEMKSKEADETKLGVINKYFNDEEKAIEIFRSLTSYTMPTSRFNVKNITEEAKNDTLFLIGLGKHQIDMAIEFNLAKWHPENAVQFFEWASENCIISETTLENWVGIGQYDEIAVGYLWRGYALLMLGRYEEAYELLQQVPVYFNKWKLSGSDVWQVDEPKLVKALLPLCKYKLSPTVENRDCACKGLDDFIKSYREPKFKLEGYLYYYHLKEMFPEVYSESAVRDQSGKIVSTKAAVSECNFSAVNVQDIVRGVKFEPGYDLSQEPVSVSDVDEFYLEGFGTAKDLVDYIEKVKSIGGYPLLSGLMDEYAVEDCAGLDPEALRTECERLLSSTDDPWLKEKTIPILEVAKGAMAEDSGVILSMK